MHSGNLFPDFRLSFRRSAHSPQLMESIHIKGKIVKLVLIDSNGRIHKMVKFCKLIHIIPHGFIGCVKNMGAIFVNLDPLNLFCINISANVIPLIYHKAGFAAFHSLMGKHRAEKPCSYDQVIIFFHEKTLFLLSHYTL